MAPTPNSALLAAHLREDTADLLALLPAARRAAAGGPGGGEATLDGIARAAYRTLRTAENLAAHAALCTAPPHPQPVCVTALAAAYVSGAAGVCRSAVFVPEWPRAPLWAMGDARLFAAALGNLLANAVQYGGERPAISVRAARRGETLLLTVADNGPGCAPSAGDRGLGLGLEVARRYARAYGGRLLAGSAPERGACFSLCLPLCPPGAAPSVPDYMADRFSPLYVQLAPVCDRSACSYAFGGSGAGDAGHGSGIAGDSAQLFKYLQRNTKPPSVML